MALTMPNAKYHRFGSGAKFLNITARRLLKARLRRRTPTARKRTALPALPRISSLDVTGSANGAQTMFAATRARKKNVAPHQTLREFDSAELNEVLCTHR